MIKKLLVPLTGRPLDRRAAVTAFLAARRFGATVAGLGVMPQAEIRASIESAAIPAALVERLTAITQGEQEAVIDGAHALFAELAAAYGQTPTWSQATGPLAETIAEEARLADLTVIAQASDGSNAMGPALEAALFSSGRGMLLAPVEEPATLGERVAVAWDGSATASRAVAAALPFLSAATVVVILSTGDGDGAAADPRRLADYLALHGIAARVDMVEVPHKRLGRALAGAACARDCDLMVMGAYGHSRMREQVLGGVTLDTLREPPPLAVLMAH